MVKHGKRIITKENNCKTVKMSKTYSKIQHFKNIKTVQNVKMVQNVQNFFFIGATICTS